MFCFGFFVAKLKMLKPRLALAKPARKSATTRDVRMTGRRLQERRLKIWAQNPRCAACGALTVFPHGFELDHIVPLFQGGQDTEANCQVLCVERLPDGRKAGCHVAKSAEDGSGGYPPRR